MLDPREEGDLGRRARDGDEKAYHLLVEKNLRLMVSVAKKYRGASPSLPLEDLIQEGNVGLMKAARRFDPEKGFRLSTYATWWIRQAVGREVVNKGWTTRVPVHASEKVRGALQAKYIVSARLGRDPSEEESALSVRRASETCRRAQCGLPRPLKPK